MAFKSYREESKTNYGHSGLFKDAMPENTSLEQINTGSLQRIADATEKMAQYHVSILQNLEYYKELSSKRAKRIEELERSVLAYKGVVGRLQKKVKTLQSKNSQ